MPCFNCSDCNFWWDTPNVSGRTGHNTSIRQHTSIFGGDLFGLWNYFILDCNYYSSSKHLGIFDCNGNAIRCNRQTYFNANCRTSRTKFTLANLFKFWNCSSCDDRYFSYCNEYQTKNNEKSERIKKFAGCCKPF